jgi:hypothetical protein
VFKDEGGSIQVPTFYLGAKLKNTVLPNGVVAWGMISSKYVQYAVQNVQEYLAMLPDNNKLLKNAPAPFEGGKCMGFMRVLSWTLPWLVSTSHRL